MSGPGESVRIALDFSHAYPGDQGNVFHCHNLEHAQAGMMIRYLVGAGWAVVAALSLANPCALTQLMWVNRPSWASA